MALQIKAAAQDLKDPDGNGVYTGGTYLMPVSISESNRAAYETQVNAIVTKSSDIITAINTIMALG
jgi:hypothetical protein